MSEAPAAHALQPLAGLPPPGTGLFSRDARFAPLSQAAPATLDEPQIDPLDAAHAQGFAEGLSAGRAEAEAARAAADAAREQFAFTFQRLDAELAEALRLRLRETVLALCEASLAPLALDPEALARRAAAAADLFRRSDDQRIIRLHPDDHALVGALLPEGWTYQDDASLARGTLRVETTSGGAEDGPVQWRRALDEALARC